MKKFVIGIGDISVKADAEHVLKAIDDINAKVKNVEMFDFEVLLVVRANEFSELGYQTVAQAINSLQGMGLIVHAVVMSESLEPEVLGAVAKADILAIGGQSEVTTQSENEALINDYEGFMDALMYQKGFSVWGEALESVIREFLIKEGQRLVVVPAIDGYIKTKLGMHNDTAWYDAAKGREGFSRNVLESDEMLTLNGDAAISCIDTPAFLPA